MRDRIKTAPRGIAMLAVLGPSFVWCAEYIGSGEVILATRTGALLGTAALWAIAGAIFLKYWIGMAGARWTAITGEGMIDMFARIPGPRNWLVWLVLVVQFPAAIVSIGALANAATTFLDSLLPLSGGRVIWGLLVSVFAVTIAWSGRFDVLKTVMSGLVLLIVVGVFYVAVLTFPPLGDLFRGLLGLSPLEVPNWAGAVGQPSSPWRELLPLIGWAAGGFASQVWYSYWVLGAGYGMAARRSWGVPADERELASLSREDAGRIRGWCSMVRTDATVAVVIGIAVTTCFALAGAGVLRPAHLVPEGREVAVTLSQIFSQHWGQLGGMLFLLSGSAAMVSTLVGQLSGWPRLLADCVRIVCPPFARRLPWKVQFRGFLTLFVATNLAAVVFFDPVKLVMLGGQLDGVLLTPIQALAILAAFVLVLPRLLAREAWEKLRPGKVLLFGLAIAGLVFGSFCVLFLPGNLAGLFSMQ